MKSGLSGGASPTAGAPSQARGNGGRWRGLTRVPSLPPAVASWAAKQDRLGKKLRHWRRKRRPCPLEGPSSGQKASSAGQKAPCPGLPGSDDRAKSLEIGAKGPAIGAKSVASGASKP